MILRSGATMKTLSSAATGQQAAGERSAPGRSPCQVHASLPVLASSA
ncbi:MAG TPA: hypothetical protein VI136_21885 [Verrucomicrobiae bacterium]